MVCRDVYIFIETYLLIEIINLLLIHQHFIVYLLLLLFRAIV